MMSSDSKIILASQSPRRKELLEALGIKFKTRIINTEETFPENLTREGIALFLAEKKAAAFDSRLEDNEILIAADTIVWINSTLLGKPTNIRDANRMLNMLSGRMHEVFTGVCILSSQKKKSFYVRTEVCFRKLTEDEISSYISQYNPFDKAGSYGAQEALPEGINPLSREELTFLKKINNEDLFDKINLKYHGDSHRIVLIEKIKGSYFNVMGLPLKELWEELDTF